jgi:hypothetical protein
VSAYVVVHLAPSRSAEPARGESAILARHDVKKLLSKHGAKVIDAPAPKSAGGRHPAACATIAVPDMARADELAAALCGMEGIDTAYAKPGEELP